MTIGNILFDADTSGAENSENLFPMSPNCLTRGGDSISGFEHDDWVDSSSDDDCESDDDFVRLW